MNIQDTFSIDFASQAGLAMRLVYFFQLPRAQVRDTGPQNACWQVDQRLSFWGRERI